MRILLATSEAVPFAKTGGLADVAGALPKAVQALGHRAAVVMPLHRKVWDCDQRIMDTGRRLIVPVGNQRLTAEIYESTLPDSDVPVYLIRRDDYFDRDGLYQQHGKDYEDNCERFVFFSRAVIETILNLEMEVDCIHANDWQTGLIPVYLHALYKNDPAVQDIGTLFTIHNIAYQGHFWHWDMLLTGLSWDLFNWRELEYYGHLNLLKSGLVFSDVLNTVSPRYAQEIQTKKFGRGMEGVLQGRRQDLHGIVNGIDYQVWNPAIDPYIAAHYDETTVWQGKPKCKRHLQEANGLPARDVPVLGVVSRLDKQKGLDLLVDIAESVLAEDVQLVLLGTGDKTFHGLLTQLAKAHPDKVGLNLTFNNELAHRIEAGADMFLMPSQFEPCGLNQLYSLKYGTVPIVHRTGGLADTITDCTTGTLADGTANGFSFEPCKATPFLAAIRRALEAYRQPKVWRQLVLTGMEQDWSWARSAKQYVGLYEEAASRHRQPVEIG